MITEDYVSFEIAKLLKEKGFDTPCDRWYSEYTPQYYGNEKHICIEFDKHNRHENNYEFICYAPTLQMAMKWLRETQGLNIYARGVWKDVEISVFGDWEPAVVGYEWFIESLTDDTYSKTSIEQFLTYEQACEAAISYCLNLI